MALKRRTLLLSIAIGLAGCATTFPYRYYGMEMPEAAYETGKLLGEKPKDDIPFSVCRPTDEDKGPCVVFLRAELEKLQRERVELIERLKACEAKP
jgi:hypothetical protein